MDNTWLSAHIYYHDDLDALIEGVVRPLAAELAASGAIDGRFFVRHWQGGPHLRLRLRPAAGADPAEVSRRVAEHVGLFLAKHPSTAVVEQEGYLRVAGPLARRERGQGEIEPLQPNNSIRWVPYEREYGRYGGTAAALETVERHFAESTGIALDVIASGRGRDHRTGQALAMMFLCAAVGEATPGGLAAFFTAGRGDWGSKLAFGDPRLEETAFEERFRRQRDHLHHLVDGLAAMVRDGATADSGAPAARWARSVGALRDGLLRLERDGLFRPGEPLLSGGRDEEEHPGLRSVLLLCSHMNNNRLGISLTEEAYLMYLLWRVVTDAGRPVGPP
ncbi:lantibiotic dehydratase C-terminal domain-containing protein [Microbispora sp. NPDC046933]|uniref:lantibiotic dehydratase C-terminal domain-containing protein n=1 Tax=Microbispora sp. NPDC046933 TaxID=3155618 RepID=UPI003401E544